MGEFHSERATVFHLGSAIDSLQMQMLPERHAAGEKEVEPREDWRCQPEGHCSQETVLVQCCDMAPLALGGPPESTALPTTKECEAFTWERVQEKEVSEDKPIVKTSLPNGHQHLLS